MNDRFLDNTNLIAYFGKHKVLLHVLYWVLWVCFFGFIWGTYDNYYLKTFSVELIQLPVKMILVYLNLYYLMPRFLFQKRYIDFLLLSMVFLLLGGLIQRLFIFYWIDPLYWPERLHEGYFNLSGILGAIMGITTPMIIPSSGKLLKYWYQNQQEQQMLEKEKLQAELKLLKSQINPHFLFNTLNSLYALSLKRSEKTPEVVMKLSELMHFMLYDANQPKVALAKEIDFIRNYIDLEKVRYEGRFDLSFTTSGEINSSYIAPLILLPFVENSFKHGVNREISGAWITFDLRVENGILNLKMENSISLESDKKTEGIPEGIGLSNLKRRLEILYPGAYELKTVKDESSWWVVLNLSL